MAALMGEGWRVRLTLTYLNELFIDFILSCINFRE